MNSQQMKQMVAGNQSSALESAWLDAMESNLPAAELAEVLEALFKSEKAGLAEALATLLLEDRTAKLAPPELLDVAKALVWAVPTSETLRTRTAQLYRQVYSAATGEKIFDAFLEASGLTGGQSPRRALRTLDTALQIVPGSYLANRYDHRVVKAKAYNELFGEFEVIDANSSVSRLEPKALADEFEIVDETDFRVLTTHRGDELKKLLSEDIAAVLAGLCMSSGGSINSNTLKDRLVPKYIAPEQWSGWWNKARTAAKRSANLSIEGRSPVVISYHAGGRTLEEELAPALAAARTPLEQLALLGTYVREVRARRLTVQEPFYRPILESLATAALVYQANRPADALAAALAVEAAGEMGLPAPEGAATATTVLAKIQNPASAIAELDQAALYEKALNALSARPDYADQLQALLPLTPAESLDQVAERLGAIGRTSAIEQAVAAAFAEPLNNLELSLWLWKGPAQRPANMPGKTELLSRLLKAMVDLEHDWDSSAARRKAVFARIRWAITASDFASVRQAVSEMSEPVAETIKRQVDRAGTALADSAREGIMAILKENFYQLFAVREKAESWADENIIWASEEAFARRQAELKELVDVKMLENARAIGAAAAHGDLKENSEWKFALEERDMLRARAANMQDELAKARILHPDNVPTDTVGVGSKVTMRRASDSKEVQLSFLGPWDCDLQKRIMNYQTPIAQELMGHAIGDSIHLKLDGEEGDYVIVKLEPAVSRQA